MIRNALLFLVLVLVFGTAACGGKPAGGTLGNTAAASKGGCPAATRVRIASWSSGAGSMEGSPKWRVPLVVRALEGDYEQFEQQRAQAAPISADALRAAGAEPLPGPVWLVLKSLALFLLVLWIRWSFLRVRIDQVLRLNWHVLFPVALANLLVAAFFALRTR